MSQELPSSPRIQSLDILRGAVMVFMAIDHVRVYAGIPPLQFSPDYFFTRWITHFCVATFVFFAGTAAFFYGRKLNDPTALVRYLVSRGLVLVIFELTLTRFGWTFNFNYSAFTVAGVIWMLGWCMVLLALFVRMRPVVIGVIGLFITVFQNLFGYLGQSLPESIGKYYNFIYPSGVEATPLGINVLYVLVPWIGVMMAGYGFGLIMLMEPAKRNKLCIQIGLSMIALFIGIGSYFILTGPATPEDPPFYIQLLNQRKYPASVLYLLMTLGPVIALIPYSEKTKGWLSKKFIVFGRVPMFYYLLHIPLIHITSLIVNLLRDGVTHQDWYGSAPFVFVDKALQWPLGLLYVVFVIDVVILYFACKWYMNYKFRHPEKGWLKYI